MFETSTYMISYVTKHLAIISVFSEINRLILVDSGGLKYLIPLLYRDNVEVQCNACGCITTLATTGKQKQKLDHLDSIIIKTILA